MKKGNYKIWACCDKQSKFCEYRVYEMGVRK